ncbi:MAG: DNA polymerase III subunit delta [Lachnospiraceae bacterium]|jgi:DNA polymerase-3 subunit delta|nr:DNA polymerase III subunit delta [Lachnospiraceae bacterium]
MKMLAEDIKNGTFKASYLLYGEESYLRSQYRNRLTNALIDPADTMNLSRFEGKGIHPEEIIDLAETLPFFAPRRVILVENSEFFKTKCDRLADYLPSMPDTTCLIFVETAVDKRNRLFKTVKDRGRAVEFASQDEATLTKWILGIVKREGKQISKSALSLFLERAGTDMEHISKELEKLLCYTYERESITSQDVEDVCTILTSNRIFDMLRAIAEKNQKQALELYYDLLTLKESPRGILTLLGRQFQQLLLVRSLMAKGYGQPSIASKTGIAPFIIRRLMGQARNFTDEQLTAALADCAKAVEDVTAGRINDVMSVELLLVKYSR